MPISLREVILRIESLVPCTWAEAWDNVGLLAGDAEQSIARVVVCQDWTRSALEAAAQDGDLQQTLVVAYHPPWFGPKQRLVGEGNNALLLDTLRAGAAIYAVHTALDAAPGGTNDALAKAAGILAARPLVAHQAPSTRIQLRVTVPPADVERVRQALTAEGAGQIGLYRGCMFEANGVGVFLPEEGANPAVGQVGSFHREGEVMLTTWLPQSATRQAAILAALRAAHPYEEPVFDLFRPESVPSAHLGQGRIGELGTNAPFASFVASLKQALGIQHLLCALPQEKDARRPVHRVAVAAGAGRSLLPAARRAGADLFITGELPHHDVLAARDAGMRVLSLLHGVSERAGVDAFAGLLKKAVPAVVHTRATRDVEPYEFA